MLALIEERLDGGFDGCGQGCGKLFVLMAHNAVRATAFFRLPPERVVELGVQVEM